MDRALRNYLKKIERDLKTLKKFDPQLFELHQIRVRDFQHERLIHLLITLFFGLLFIGTLITLFVTAGMGIINVLCIILAVILLVTELFYIRHYYFLENGVQKLYDLTDRFAALPLDDK